MEHQLHLSLSLPMQKQTDEGKPPRVEYLVDVRLKSSWGRPTKPIPIVSEMHEIISEISVNDANITDRYFIEREWRKVQLRCETHPSEAGRLDRRGRSCLHAACAKRAPTAVINSILQACGRHGEAVLERDKHGRTPLAIAISSNASLSVIARLLKSSNRAAGVGDHSGDLPLHLACFGYDHGAIELVDMLLHAYPEAAARENNSGRTPLHAAVDANGSLEMITKLAEVCPQAVVMNGCGLNPLFMAIRRNASPRVILALVDANPTSTNSRDRGNGLPLRRAVENQLPIEILQALATGPEIVTDADGCMGHSVLHNALECGIPEDAVVRTLASISPAVASQNSRSGQTPLVLACRRFLRTYRQRATTSTRQSSVWNSLCHLLRAAHYGRINEDDPILHAAAAAGVAATVTDIVLKHHPEQAKERDSTGDFPLVLAIQSPRQRSKSALVMMLLKMHEKAVALPTSSGRSVLAVATQSEGVDHVLLDEIVMKHPASLRAMDPYFRLYPFQVAAVKKHDNDNSIHALTWDEPIDQDIYQLTAVYKLLVQAPDLIQAHLP